MMRQIGKQILTILAAVVLAGSVRAESLVTTIVTDPLTGVAIDGYDPVSYFLYPEPVEGKPDFEYDWGGVPWYFESAANRDVFIRNPTIYAPQYGGYCLMSLSRGYLSDGKPRLYVVEALKLYFFYSSANRDAFILAKNGALMAAAKNWPDLSKNLMGAGAEAPVAPSGDASSSAPADASSSAADSSASSAPISSAEAAPSVAPTH